VWTPLLRPKTSNTCHYGNVLTWRSRAVFFQAEDGIRDRNVTGVQTCALPICTSTGATWWSTPTDGPPGCSRHRAARPATVRSTPVRPATVRPPTRPPGSGPRELGPGKPRRDRRLHRRPPGAGPAADPDRLPALAAAGQARHLPRLAAHFGHHRLLPDVRDPLPATVRAAAGSDRHRRAQPREHHHRAVAVRARAHGPHRLRRLPLREPGRARLRDRPGL